MRELREAHEHRRASKRLQGFDARTRWHVNEVVLHADLRRELGHRFTLVRLPAEKLNLECVR